MLVPAHGIYIGAIRLSLIFQSTSLSAWSFFLHFHRYSLAPSSCVCAARNTFSTTADAGATVAIFSCPEIPAGKWRSVVALPTVNATDPPEIVAAKTAAGEKLRHACAFKSFYNNQLALIPNRHPPLAQILR
ncbi:hypothetical protein ACWWD9_13725 [Methylovorus sp. SPW-M1]